MDGYHAGNASITYPGSIRRNAHARAFYGVLCAIFDEAPETTKENPDSGLVAEISRGITRIVAGHSQVDWTNNKTIRGRIAQDIDDLFYKYEKERGLKLSFDMIDRIIENVLSPAEVLGMWSERTVPCGGRAIRYVLERKQVKNLNLRVRRNGDVFVSANPRVPSEKVHEFCHFVHPDHSRRFYAFLTTPTPDWEERKTALGKCAAFGL